MIYTHVLKKQAVASGAQSMTYEWSYTVCIKPALGRGGPQQAFDMKAFL